MRIKSLLVIAVLATAILFSAGAAKAITIDEVRQQIAQLQALLAQMLVQQDQPQTPAIENTNANSDNSDASWCYNFKQNLWLGKKGKPVEALQIALAKEGLFKADLIKNPWAFGVSTKVAVTKFQKKYNIKTTGTVGPVTNDKLNELYGCKTTQPSITVTSPNGGEAWKIGENRQIAWKTNFEDSVTVRIVNYGKNDSCTLAENVSAAKGWFDFFPITGTGRCPQDVLIGDKIKVAVSGITTDGRNVTDESDNYFTIAVADTTQPSITVTSPNGGETWRIGETHTITWTSSGISTSESVFIHLFDDRTDTSGWGQFITGLTPNTGSYTWTIPSSVNGSTIPTGRRFKIRVDKTGAKDDTSDNYFTIAAAATACTGYSDNYVVINSAEVGNGTLSFKLTNTKTSTQTVNVSIDSGTVNPTVLTVPAGTCSSPTVVTYTAPSSATITFTNSEQVIASFPVSATTSYANTADLLASISASLAKIMEAIKNLAGR